MPDPNGDFFQNIRAKLPAAMQAGYDAWHRDYMDFRNVFSKNEKQLAAEHIGFGKFYVLASGGQAGDLRSEDVGGWMVRAMYFSMGRRHDYRPPLRRVQAPVLVVHGERDLQPVASSRIYVDALPNAQFEIVKGSSHFPHIDAAESFAPALRRFLLDE
jgi:proline iminopeptidase